MLKPINLYKYNFNRCFFPIGFKLVLLQRSRISWHAFAYPSQGNPVLSHRNKAAAAEWTYWPWMKLTSGGTYSALQVVVVVPIRIEFRTTQMMCLASRHDMKRPRKLSKRIRIHRWICKRILNLNYFNSLNTCYDANFGSSPTFNSYTRLIQNQLQL